MPYQQVVMRGGLALWTDHSLEVSMSVKRAEITFDNRGKLWQ